MVVLPGYARQLTMLNLSTMKKFSLPAGLLLFVLSILFSSVAFAQQPMEKRASPLDSVSGQVGASRVKIKYGSPSVKGRKIWGDLVPYDQVWRAGANEATTVTFDKPVKVKGKPLAAGTYSLFVVPAAKKKWTVIFNKVAEQWGAYKYDPKQDALRVTVTPKKTSFLQERLAYAVEKNKIVLRWEKMEVAVPVK
jgi:hypothetical protein